MHEIKFISRRNSVTLRGGLVYKQTQSPLHALEEASILRCLHAQNVAVPQVLGCRGAVLVMEYLPGEPLPDLIEHGNYGPEALAAALCDWFAAFYAAVPEGECRGDVNGRNFLYHEGKISGLDFEARALGSMARDAGRLEAFLRTYRTRCAAKQAVLAEAFAKKFAERFRCRLADIFLEKEAELKAMRARRGEIS